ncbi:STE family protein kinase [Histomonas meleagridis]|uniref:STE family protein kinase n=1 Tax=Histomonas meleagridis TaxID=135588 RepID=UPI00355A16DC|nr:STE family protein kinase [Histomonas meleagridis]KAH0804160.1 STE family protein kinase [Histomonas meleagridis]
MTSLAARRKIGIPKLTALETKPPNKEVEPKPLVPKTEQGNSKHHQFEFQDFEIGPSLGSGASSTVYKAIHIPTGKVYAVKKIAFHNQPKELTQQVVSETYALRVLSHENIVTLNTVIYHKGFVYIVMPLIDGGSLFDMLRFSPIVPEAALGRIAWQCLQGLLYIRKNKFLHRDFKPGNILITKSGEVKIADFGMARQLNQSIDQAQSFLGTICYMSPERLNEKKYNFQSDLWSFGIILYQCALGRFPISFGDSKSPNYWDLIGKLTTDIDVKLPPQYSPGLTDLIASCLRIDPAKRVPVERLVEHPWVVQFRDKSANGPLLQWIAQCERIRKEQESAMSRELMGAPK